MPEAPKVLPELNDIFVVDNPVVQDGYLEWSQRRWDEIDERMTGVRSLISEVTATEGEK